jgi:hypothetical protein
MSALRQPLARNERLESKATEADKGGVPMHVRFAPKAAGKRTSVDFSNMPIGDVSQPQLGFLARASLVQSLDLREER